jgi:hypothetical protein
MYGPDNPPSPPPLEEAHNTRSVIPTGTTEPYGPDNSPPPVSGPLPKKQSKRQGGNRHKSKGDKYKPDYDGGIQSETSRDWEEQRRKEPISRGHKNLVDDNPNRIELDGERSRAQNRQGREESVDRGRHDYGDAHYRYQPDVEPQRMEPGHYRPPPRDRDRSQSPSRNIERVHRQQYRGRSPSYRTRSRSPRAHKYYDKYEERDEGRSSSYTDHRRARYGDSEDSRSIGRHAHHSSRYRHVDAPPTAFPLHDYTLEIKATHAQARFRNAEPEDIPRFQHGDGKVNPSAYGSRLERDLGLCYATFKTRHMCEMGHKCPWRHHPLTSAEEAWILNIAGNKGHSFVEDANALWRSPDVPVPGGKLFGQCWLNFQTLTAPCV